MSLFFGHPQKPEGEESVSQFQKRLSRVDTLALKKDPDSKKRGEQYAAVVFEITGMNLGTDGIYHISAKPKAAPSDKKTRPAIMIDNFRVKRARLFDVFEIIDTGNQIAIPKQPVAVKMSAEKDVVSLLFGRGPLRRCVGVEMTTKDFRTLYRLAAGD